MLTTLSARPLELHDRNSGLYLGYLPIFPEHSKHTDTANRGGKLTLFSADSVVSEVVVIPRERSDWSPLLLDLGDKIRLDYMDKDTLHVEVGKDRRLRLVPSRNRTGHP